MTNPESSLDAVISNGAKAGIYRHDGSSGASRTPRAWHRWLPKWTSSKTLRTLLKTFGVLFAMSLAVLMVSFALPEDMTGPVTMITALVDAGITSMAVGCERFLSEINRLGNQFAYESDPDSSIAPVPMEDDLDQGTWTTMAVAGLMPFLMSLVTSMIYGVSPLAASGVFGVAVCGAVVGGLIGRKTAKRHVERLEGRLQAIREEQDAVEGGDPSNVLDTYVAAGDPDARAVVARYQELEDKINHVPGESLDVWRNKYVLAFQSLHDVFLLRTEVKRRPRDYDIDVAEVDGLLKATVKTMIRSIDKDVKALTARQVSSVRIGVDYVQGLDDPIRSDPQGVMSLPMEG